MDSYSNWFNSMGYSNLSDYIQAIINLDYNVNNLYDYHFILQEYSVQSAIDLSKNFFSSVIVVLFLSYFISLSIDFIKKI